jgi:hypothetical protein
MTRGFEHLRHIFFPGRARLERLLPVIFVLTALSARLICGPRTIDDSYITFRYTRHILAGNGFVFNPGEAVLGTTTPLYTILLTILGWFNGGAQAPFPQLAWVVNALADAGSTVLLFDLGRRLGSLRVGLSVALLWAVAPFSVTFAIGGLETSLYVLLLVGTASAHLRERHRLAALLAAGAILTRPDALIFIIPIIADRLVCVSRSHLQGINRLKMILRIDSVTHQPVASVISGAPIRFWVEGLLLILPLVPWLLYATLTFGSPVPHSIAAKSLAYRLPASAALVRLIQHYATPFHDNLTFGSAGIAVGLVLYPFLFLIGARKAYRLNQRSWALSLYPWAYFAVFAIANPLIFRWYLTPPLPAYFLFILIGLDHLLVALSDRLALFQPGVGWRNWLTARLNLALLMVFVVLAPTAMVLREWRLHPDHGLDRPAPGMAWYQLELLYRQAAQELEPLLSPASVLAAGDVGVLGYYTPARILDTVGLNSPEALHYYPLDPAMYAINYAIPPNLIVDTQPDYVVILEVYGRLGLLRDPRFQAMYELIKKIPTNIYGSDGMLLFRRKP